LTIFRYVEEPDVLVKKISEFEFEAGDEEQPRKNLELQKEKNQIFSDIQNQQESDDRKLKEQDPVSYR
jgi:hypothetical protein